ncbi:MAG: metallophosphoesterase [Paraclostridium sp.]
MKIVKNMIKGIFIFIIFIGILITSLYVYSKYIEPKILITESYSINEDIQDKDDEIKVVQFTDTQLGEFYSIEQLAKVVEKINKQDADIVVFTGDLIDRVSGYEYLEEVPKILSSIEAKLGKFAVWGNHDYGGGGHNYYKHAMESAGFKVLENETEEINLENGKSITVSGLDEVMFRTPKPEVIKNNISEDSFNLLLLHEPDLIDNFINSNINLALAGHSHGGQVEIPFIGAIVTPPYAQKYTDGFYKISGDNKNRIYVNSGLGNTKMVFRFMNIPKISVFNINI